MDVTHGRCYGPSKIRVQQLPWGLPDVCAVDDVRKLFFPLKFVLPHLFVILYIFTSFKSLNEAMIIYSSTDSKAL